MSTYAVSQVPLWSVEIQDSIQSPRHRCLMPSEMLCHLRYTPPRLADVSWGSKRPAPLWDGSWRPDRTLTRSKVTLTPLLRKTSIIQVKTANGVWRMLQPSWPALWPNCISTDYGGSTDFQHTLLNIGFLILNWVPLHPDFDSKMNFLNLLRPKTGQQDKTPCVPLENGKYRDQILMPSDLLQNASTWEWERGRLNYCYSEDTDFSINATGTSR